MKSKIKVLIGICLKQYQIMIMSIGLYILLVQSNILQNIILFQVINLHIRE